MYGSLLEHIAKFKYGINLGNAAWLTNIAEAYSNGKFPSCSTVLPRSTVHVLVRGENKTKQNKYWWCGLTFFQSGSTKSETCGLKASTTQNLLN